jgi:hypothetical protein
MRPILLHWLLDKNANRTPVVASPTISVGMSHPRMVTTRCFVMSMTVSHEMSMTVSHE